MTYCKNCGCQINEPAKFCQECGKPLDKKNKQKNKWIAIVLLLLFGYLGLHRFYLKQEFEGTMFLLCVLISLFIAFFGYNYIFLIIVTIALFIDLILIIKEV